MVTKCNFFYGSRLQSDVNLFFVHDFLYVYKYILLIHYRLWLWLGVSNFCLFLVAKACKWYPTSSHRYKPLSGIEPGTPRLKVHCSTDGATTVITFITTTSLKLLNIKCSLGTLLLMVWAKYFTMLGETLHFTNSVLMTWPFWVLLSEIICILLMSLYTLVFSYKKN